MLQFKDSKTKTMFSRALKNLTEEKQSKFAGEVKRIADKKIVSESDDFTITFEDLKIAILKI